jgi:glycosyltransferase involved in cell wall biosynthesis
LVVHRHVLILGDSLDGGLGAAVIDEATWFASRSWRVTVAAPGKLLSGGDVNHLPLPLPESIRSLRALLDARRVLGEFLASVDLAGVHCHGARSFVLAKTAGVQRPLVTHHGFGRDPRESLLYYAGRRRAISMIPAVCRQAFAASPDIPGGGWTFAPIASPVLSELASPVPLRERDGIPAFGWIGRLEAPKRPEVFVQALAQLGEQRVVRGVIAGDGRQRGELEELSDRIGAPVTFVGRAAPERVLEQVRALVLISGFEAVSFAAQEAMWAGRPVVASRLPGLEWLLGTEGLYADDATELAARMSTLLDLRYADALGSRARSRAQRLLCGTSPWAAAEQALLGDSA